MRSGEEVLASDGYGTRPSPLAFDCDFYVIFFPNYSACATASSLYEACLTLPVKGFIAAGETRHVSAPALILILAAKKKRVIDMACNSSSPDVQERQHHLSGKLQKKGETVAHSGSESEIVAESRDPQKQQASSEVISRRMEMRKGRD